MPSNRLFATLVVMGASLTGVTAIATVAAVAAPLTGCSDDSSMIELDLGNHIDAAFFTDIAIPPDLAKHD